ncbi:MAG: S8 family peptidase [Nitriliruptorales bacterium]
MRAVAAFVAVVLGPVVAPSTAAASGHGPAASGRPGVGPTAQTAGTYSDVCGDAGSTVFDLRRVKLDHDSDTGQIEFTAITCGTWSPSQLGSGSVTWTLSTQRRVEITQTGGLLLMETHDSSSGTDVLVGTGAVSRPDSRTVVTTASAALLGGAEFDFLVELVGPDANYDRMAETGNLVFPNDCEVGASQRRIVEADPGRVGAVAAVARAAGYGVGRRIDSLGLLELQVPSGVLRPMSALPHVRGVGRPLPVERLAVTPDDPSASDQWALTAISAHAGWESIASSGLKLAVIDDGIDGTREDLTGRVLSGLDTRTGSTIAKGANSDLGGHGTAVSGVAAARGDNGKAMAGVDWGAELIPYRVFDAMGCGDTFDIASAITDAVSRGATVANLSLGTQGDDPFLRTAVESAISNGLIVVAASGNGGDSTPTYPAAYPDVIGVGATTRTNELAFYSSTGAQVDVVAPGGKATGTAADDVLTLTDFGKVEPRAGTSFSAPHVSGAILLYLALNPNANLAEVTAALQATSTDLGPSGRDDQFGYGLLDLSALLTWEGASGGAPPLEACPDGEVDEDGFTDFPDGATHEDAVDCIVWWGIAKGIGDGKYGPANSVTREQMATFVRNAVRETGAALDSSTDHFTDDDDSVHEDAINALATAGIVSGVGGGRYAPGSHVSRAQMAKFLVEAYRYVTNAEITATKDFFTDDEDSVLESFINEAATAGFASGVGGDRYNPDGKVSRAQMGTFLKNLLEGFVAAGAAVPPSAR